MNPDSTANEPPAGTFTFRRVQKPRVPDKGYRQGAAILELHTQFVVGHLDIQGAGTDEITR